MVGQVPETSLCALASEPRARRRTKILNIFKRELKLNSLKQEKKTNSDTVRFRTLNDLGTVQQIRI